MEIPFESKVRHVIKNYLDSESKRIIRFSTGVPSDDPVLGEKKGTGLQIETSAKFLTLPRKFPIPKEIPRLPLSFDSGTTDPSVAENYDLFFNTSTKKLKIYFDSAWHIIGVLDTSNNLVIAGRYLHE